jgi:hypothetical protein
MTCPDALRASDPCQVLGNNRQELGNGEMIEFFQALSFGVFGKWRLVCWAEKMGEAPHPSPVVPGGTRD